ncbi:MAG: tetratricopeptide repeat protein [Saprospiraceae bacterium]|nr:tetratricopeptide repeat protein [Lewinella sp.]
MKYLISLSSVLLLSTFLNAQNTLAGLVKLQSSGKTPLPNVEVYALGAQTTYTNDKGYFELHFSSKSAGDLVGAIEFSLEGYVLINEEKSQGLTIPKDPTLAPLQIVMSSKDVFREQKAMYYGIIIDHATEGYRQQNVQIRQQLAGLDTQLQKLQSDSGERERYEEERRILLQQIDNLQQEKEQVIANAERYAQIFARIDIDEASRMAGEALKLFETGKVKEAISLMDDDQLRRSLQDAQAAKAEAQHLSMQADSMLQQCVSNYLLKARLCAADLQWGAAYKNYKYAIEGDSTNVDHLLELAFFCGELNQQQRAITFYRQALRHGKTDMQKATILNNLGSELRNDNRYDDSRRAYSEALDICRRLLSIDTAVFEAEMAMINNNLGNLYADLFEYDNAKAAFLNALAIRKRLAESDSETFGPYVARTLNNLGILYANLNDYEQAERTYLESLKIGKRLATADPEKHEPALADIYNNLGNLYADLNAYEKADSSLQQALRIYRRLAAINPERYDPDVAIVQHNLGQMYTELNAYEKAKNAYQEALAIRNRLAETNPNRYDPDVAITQDNLGGCYYAIDEFDRAGDAYRTALAINSRLVKAKPERFERELAKNFNNLGNLYLSLQEYDRADSSLRQALDIYQRLSRANDGRFDPEVSTIQNNLGILYANQMDFAKAESVYLEALATRERLAEINPDRYDPDVSSTLTNLGNLYAQMGNYQQSEAAFLKSLEIKRRFAGREPDKYNIEVARSALLLGIIYYQQGEEKKALGLFREALRLSDQYPGLPLAESMGGAVIEILGMEKADPDFFSSKEKAAGPQRSVAEQNTEKAKAEPQKEVVTIWEETLSRHSENPRVQAATVDAYDHLAHYLLFSEDFRGAESIARRALEVNPTAEWVFLNLAHALLLQGRYAEAEVIYLERKDQAYKGAKNWGQAAIEDLNALESAGITHADVEKIRRVLRR